MILPSLLSTVTLVYNHHTRNHVIIWSNREWYKMILLGKKRSVFVCATEGPDDILFGLGW